MRSVVTLYTKPNCPLCDEADRTLRRCLRQWSVRYETVDITTDPVLLQAYGQTVPVVAVDGTALFFGKISAFRLQRVLSERGIPARNRAFMRRFAR